MLLKMTIIVVCIFIFVLGGFFLLSTIMRYRPSPVEDAVVIKEINSSRVIPDTLSILTWNIGYASLGKEADFFIDGGTHSRALSRGKVVEHLGKIIDAIKNEDPDFVLLQEVDLKARRNFYVREVARIVQASNNFSATFSKNYDVLWIPAPLLDMMGSIKSGILTLSQFKQKEAKRISLPGSYRWPISIFQLNRCIMVNRYDLKNSNKELVLINIHLSAFDKGGTLRKQQMEFLKNLIIGEYRKENYVVVGGDWNHRLTDRFNFDTTYTTDKKYLAWGLDLPKDWAPQGWKWGIDNNVPTNRSNESPFIDDKNFKTIIDGFLVSPNIKIIKVRGINLHFNDSDHNPVFIKISVKTKHLISQ